MRPPDYPVLVTLPNTLFNDLNLTTQTDAPLGPLTWYGIGGRAQALVTPEDDHTLATLLTRCREQDIPFRVLGSGANLLVADTTVPGVVVRLSHHHFRAVDGLETRTGHLTIGAGADLMNLVNETARHGLAGLEVLAGVPASLGGAIRMNAGGAYGQIADAITSVTLLDHTGQSRTLTRDQIGFGYRRSGITDPIITSATLTLTPDDPQQVMARKKDIFATKKTQQPFAARSAGCAFKNPVDDQGNPCDSAGRLIDQCGLKGFRLGGAVVSEKHANFITADDHAHADDVIRLFQHVQDEVERQTGTRLTREIVIWP